MPNTKLNEEIIQAAIAGFEFQKQQIDEKIAELRNLLGGSNTAAPTAAAEGKRQLSTAARERIAAAQRKRWAATRKGSGTAGQAKPKRRLSAEGRRRIIEATKARWARVRAEASKAAKSKKSSSNEQAAS